MLIHGADRTSHLKTCLDAAAAFLLDTTEASALIHAQIQTIELHWQAICDEAELSSAERQFLWGRQFLNPFAFQGLSI
jgi:serine/threonine-protein kinase HipA